MIDMDSKAFVRCMVPRCHPSSWHWLAIKFKKMLRNLPNKKKAKETPLVANYLY